MTEPVQYETRPDHAIAAMQYDGTELSAMSLRTWVAGQSADASGVDHYTTPMGVLVIVDGAETIQLQPEYYLYLAADGFHVASKLTFELYYQVANGA